ncbi:glutamate racemase [Candidatus Gracilibacteria bacterium CG17_big_fil_post_rev_8_21_14_2_50_48_13]|nr:MAG: glutamate racemase [Candidatus Gracilibacteria bacterium CG17_big_fil_post_rev_8_21_14_2_50_48_13]
MNIGVFDSGLGGLTVLKELTRAFPEYHYIYLGDTARNPYGTRSKETITQYVREAASFFFEQKNCELVIVACNTASADALRAVQQTYLPTLASPTKRILGVLIPTAEAAVAATKNKRIGIIATRGTVSSAAYLREIGKLDPKISVYQKATPLLVPLIEEGWATRPETRSILKKYLRSLKDAAIDTLILGCTHYPILEKDVRRIMGKQVQIITSAAATHGRLDDYLMRHPDLANTLSTEGGVEYFTTDDPTRFSDLGKRVFHGNMGTVHRVELA